MQKIDSFLDDLNFSLEEDGADDADEEVLREEIRAVAREEENSIENVYDVKEFLQEIMSGEPEIIEMRSSEYNHTGQRCLLATMSLKLPLDCSVLSDFSFWEPKIRLIVNSYFQAIYSPNRSDSDFFLPEQFMPYEVINTADEMAHKKRSSNQKAADYLSEHNGPVVVAGDSIYQNFRAKSWMIKFWMVAENDKFKFLLEV